MTPLSSIERCRQEFLPLHRDRVDVWILPIEREESEFQILKSFLSNDERERSVRFSTPLLQRHDVIARGKLRLLLGNYLETKPDEIEILSGKMGKPYVKLNHKKDIFFNLSHSKGRLIYAFGNVSELGVDIEFQSETTEIDEVAKRCFTANELSVYSLMTSEEKRKVFFRGWTRKESLLKAAGVGLTISMMEIEVNLATLNFSEWQKVQLQWEVQKTWHVRDLEVKGPYCAALASKNAIPNVRMFDFTT
jgi:4'-phosphopantetheinyl transferase